MKEKAMLDIRNIKTTRNLVDWVINYMAKMKLAISTVEAFQGKLGTQTKTAGMARVKGTNGGG